MGRKRVVAKSKEWSLDEEGPVVLVGGSVYLGGTELIRRRVFLDVRWLRVFRELPSSTEWLMYIGELYEEPTTNAYVIPLTDDVIIPEQEVTSASVDVKDSRDAPVVIHKHPEGLRSFSGIDREYVNQNHTVSIIWAGGFSLHASVRERIDGGVFWVYEADVEPALYGDVEIEDVLEVIREQLGNIKEKTYTVQSVYYPSEYYAYYYRDEGGEEKEWRKKLAEEEGEWLED